MDENSNQVPYRGFSDLLTPNTDKKDNNEELAKEMKLQFNNLISLFHVKLEDLNYKINEMDKKVIPAKKSFSINIDKNKKNVLYLAFVFSMLFGVLIGKVITPEPKVAVVKKADLKRSPAIVQVKDEYVTAQYVNMRASSTTKAKVLKTIPPNTLLQRVDDLKGWYKVKYRDYLAKKDVIGWVWSEGLRSYK